MIKRAILGVIMMVATAFPSFAGDGATREAAMAMANAAKQYYSEHGLNDLKSAVQDPENSAFHDGELYVFVMDFNRMMLAHGANPALAGKDMTNVRDPNGNDFNGAMVDVARAGGNDWVNYSWTHPLTKKVAPKSGYVVRIDDNMFVGVGIYTNS